MVSIFILAGVAQCNRDSRETAEYTDSRIQRGKISFFPMLDLMKSGQILNPIRVASKVYWDVVMSTMLYGIEFVVHLRMM